MSVQKSLEKKEKGNIGEKNEKYGDTCSIGMYMKENKITNICCVITLHRTMLKSF